MKMKINRSAKSESSAQEILAFLQGDKDAARHYRDPVISLSSGGDLLFRPAAVPPSNDETVLINRIDQDSLGYGWASATADDVIQWLEDNWLEDNCE